MRLARAECRASRVPSRKSRFYSCLRRSPFLPDRSWTLPDAHPRKALCPPMFCYLLDTGCFRPWSFSPPSLPSSLHSPYLAHLTTSPHIAITKPDLQHVYWTSFILQVLDRPSLFLSFSSEASLFSRSSASRSFWSDLWRALILPLLP